MNVEFTEKKIQNIVVQIFILIRFLLESLPPKLSLSFSWYTDHDLSYQLFLCSNITAGAQLMQNTNLFWHV